MIERAQPTAKLVGEEGCYALVILKIAEKILRARHPGTVPRLPILEMISDGMARNFIDSTCTVTRAGDFLSFLVGEEWEVLKAGEGLDSGGNPYPLPKDYVLKAGEYEGLRFERKKKDALGCFVLDMQGNAVIVVHFVSGAGDGKTVDWDPWPGSLTVQYGSLVGRRIARRKGV